MKRILIADDVRAVRMVLRRQLNKLSRDWIIEEACDGEETLDCYFASEPDVILLDVEIPEADGWEVLQTIREVDKDVIIIMVTASDSPGDVVRAVSLGASGFVGKPFDPEELADALGVEFVPEQAELLIQG